MAEKAELSSFLSPPFSLSLSFSSSIWFRRSMSAIVFCFSSSVFSRCFLIRRCSLILSSSCISSSRAISLIFWSYSTSAARRRFFSSSTAAFFRLRAISSSAVCCVLRMFSGRERCLCSLVSLSLSCVYARCCLYARCCSACCRRISSYV